MIKKVRIKNFKCFSEIEFGLGNINLLAGSNGCGKSSFIHTLLLLRQSWEQGDSLEQLHMYGKYINIGYAKEILYENAKEDEISISLWNEEGKHIDVTPKYEAEMYSLRSFLRGDCNLDAFNLFASRFEYISAERIVPQNTFSVIRSDTSLGIHGENTLSFLEEMGLKIRVAHELCMEGSEQEYLLYQINEWLSILFNGFRLKMSALPEADSVSLRYQESGSKMSSTQHRAINVGFGITYVLPILVALLTAEKDELIIIENPEAHLHPAAQRKLSELMLRAASMGAQIILETHSDHILNGLRLGVKNNKIDANLVKLFFFMRENIGQRYNVNVYSPILNQEGDIDIWPEGFFDEWDKALMELF